MAKVNKILLNNFRNFEKKEIIFDSKLNVFFGDNGSGKTNVLEGISLISKGKGIRNSNISNLIKNNKNFFSIKSILDIQNIEYEIEIITNKIDDKLKKIVSVNDDSSKDSINILNTSLSFLIFLPEMERLFQSSPTFRRNFLDRIIFSEKNDYNKLINKYKRNIFERAKILQKNQYDSEWINIVENEIIDNGLEIYNLRNSKLQTLNDHISKLNKLNNYQFEINLDIKDNFYSINLDKDYYKSQLESLRDIDSKFGGSKIGPHKSDISAIINKGTDASQLSTGQQKTVVLMMILGQCDYLVNSRNIKPILLFDEICSHLDSHNRKILLDIIEQFDIQLFLTGTERSLFSFVSTKSKFYNITNI